MGCLVSKCADPGTERLDVHISVRPVIKWVHRFANGMARFKIGHPISKRVAGDTSICDTQRHTHMFKLQSQHLSDAIMGTTAPSIPDCLDN